MASVLILFAHPALEKSRVQLALLQAARQTPGITLHDLYEAYPDFDIDTHREQQKLLQHDVILFQHPFYWYSAPAMVKQWLDLVLEHGWAYGREGTMLRGKCLGNVISTGGADTAYTSTGRNRFTIAELLRPFEQTAMLCQMQYLPPFVVHGTHRLQQSDITMAADTYAKSLRWLLATPATQLPALADRYLQHYLPQNPA